ncbi:MAG: cyclic nucleotide-binding domain-containing protein [Pseudomonadales bacterium]|nr:cyclic nucleotide-binding domain-containing protein [Pseudomonadales bacterium]
MTTPIHKLIPKLEVFNFLDEDDYKTLEKYMFRYDYDENAYVFKEGTHGGYMFFIVEGSVEVIKQFDDKKHTIAELGPGRSVGEMSLIDGAPRSATVRAKETLALIVLKREDFNRMLDEEPAVANKVLMGIATLLSHSLRETNKNFTEKLLSIC